MRLALVNLAYRYALHATRGICSEPFNLPAYIRGSVFFLSLCYMALLYKGKPSSKNFLLRVGE